MGFTVLERIQRTATEKITSFLKLCKEEVEELFHLGKMTTRSMTTDYRCVHLLLRKLMSDRK